MNSYDIFARFYDDYKSSDDYDHFMGQYMAIAQKNGFCGGVILDVGCGTGASMVPLLKWGYRVDGVDLSEKMLDVAKVKVDGYASKLFHLFLRR